MILNSLYNQHTFLFMPLLFQIQKSLKKQSVNDINLPNCSYDFCTNESLAGGTLLYVRNHLSYQLRKETSIYKSYELE